jgi:hypothetical protein
MDWEAFISSLIASLAWPSVIIVLLIVLREQIVGLAEQLQELSLPGGAKATFQRGLEIAREEAENLPPAPATSHSERIVSEAEERRFLRLAASAPEMAVAEAYKRIEGVLNKIAPLLDLHNVDNPHLVVNELMKRGLIDTGALALFNTLRQARNVAVHVGPGRITPNETLDYGEHTDKLSGNLHYVLGRLEGQKKHFALSLG